MSYLFFMQPTLQGKKWRLWLFKNCQLLRLGVFFRKKKIMVLNCSYRMHFKGFLEIFNFSSVLFFLQVDKSQPLITCVCILQLALNVVRYQNATFLKKWSLSFRFIIEIFVGFLFPLWSIAFLVAPKSRLGSKIIL